MDFTLTPEQLAFRNEVRALLADYLTPEILEASHRTGTFADAGLHRRLAERGWLDEVLPGPADHDPMKLYLLFNELELAGAPYDGLVMNLMIAGVIHHIGGDFLKRTVLARLLRGEGQFCLGYSEPESGSDVADARTRARWTGSDWVINGHKMWTTLSHIADWSLLLTRTGDEGPKHSRLTMFVLPMGSAGVSIKPVWTMGFERTNAVYLDDVRVDDRWRIGEVGGGWAVMTTALSFERGVMGHMNEGAQLLASVLPWVHESGLFDDESFRQAFASIAIDNQVAALLGMKAAWVAASGGLPWIEGSMSKLFMSTAYQRAIDAVADFAGAAALVEPYEADAPAGGWLGVHLRHAPVTTISGGTAEIIRNAVAENDLHLPKLRRGSSAG